MTDQLRFLPNIFWTKRNNVIQSLQNVKLYTASFKMTRIYKYTFINMSEETFSKTYIKTEIKTETCCLDIFEHMIQILNKYYKFGEMSRFKAAMQRTWKTQGKRKYPA